MYEKDTPRIAKQRLESALPRPMQVVHYEDPQAFSHDAIADGKMVNWIKEQVKAGPSKERDGAKHKSKLVANGLALIRELVLPSRPANGVSLRERIGSQSSPIPEQLRRVHVSEDSNCE
jgi:hypothetical protein